MKHIDKTYQVYGISINYTIVIIIILVRDITIGLYVPRNYTLFAT